MADNVTANPGVGGAVFKTDDDGTAHWPYAKLAWGADNTQTPVTTGGSAVPIQDGGNSITVDGTVAVSGTVAVTDNAGSLTVDGTVAVSTINSVAPAFGTGLRGATVQRVTVATDDVVPVSQSGTWTVQPGNTANTTAWKVDGSAVTQPVSLATNTPVGNVAHDAADSGNPIKIGAKATTALSGLTLVADADRTDLFSGVDGVQITRPHTNLESVTSGVAAITDGSSTSVIAAAGAGVKTYITSVVIANSSASNVTVDLRDGTAGSVKATFPAPANGGVVLSLPVPLGFTANTAVAADPSAAASTVTVTLIGFKSKV